MMRSDPVETMAANNQPVPTQRTHRHSVHTFNAQSLSGERPQVPPRRRSVAAQPTRTSLIGQPTRSSRDNAEEGTRHLVVEVVSCQALAKKDIFGASDPYVRIDLNTINGDVNIDSVLTKTKKKTLNPVWGETFVFRVKPTEHKLVFQVFDENRLTRDDFLGMVEINLADVQTRPPMNAVVEHYNLRPRRSVGARSRVRGQIRLCMSYTDDATATDAAEWDTSIDQQSLNSSITIDDTLAENGTAGSEDQLPMGWEERQDANGRTYYVNHVARTTQWERPTSTGTYGVTEEDINNAAADFQRRFHISVDESENRSNQDDLDQSDSGSVHHVSLQASRASVTSAASPSGPSSAHQSRQGSTEEGVQQQQIQQPLQAPQQSQQPRPGSGSGEGGSSSSNSSVSGGSSGPQSSSITPDGAGLPTGWSMQMAPNGRVFFIDHNLKKTSWVDPRTGRASPMPNALGKPTAATGKPEDDVGPLPEGWEERVHSDGRIFYIDHNTRITQWDDPRLSNPNIAGQAVPYSRDYKQKYEYFKSQLRKPTHVPNRFEIKVRRASIFEDSYRVLNLVKNPDLLKTKLWIEFEGETGLDYGGLAREWFFLLSKEMFNPYYGLFEYSAMDNYTLQINPISGLCNEEHLNYFKFIGTVAGMAVYHGKLLDGFFIRPFYKMMLQKPIDLKDMESVDMEYYNSLLYIKENDPRELMMTFSLDEETFGATNQRELKPNGANIEVTDENKDEYIKLVIEWRFVARVKEQMKAFFEGFGMIVPLNMLKIFDENELELLMCGIQNIDVKDWKKNTLYKGDYYANHVIVQWFWRAVLSFSNEMRARLLQFVTGTSRVPMNGFKELYGSNGPQMFTIEKWGTPDNYPRAHTCFNRLDLPAYESYLQLKDKLVKAIEGSQGFAGVD